MNHMITFRAIFACTFIPEGDCKYKNPDNRFKCNGCMYAKLMKIIENSSVEVK